MPPRLARSNASTTVSSILQSPCSQPTWIAYAASPPRKLSQTRPQLVTTRRRKFYDWLNGPGLQLKQPLPGSTNYLGAYDKLGRLVRAPNWRRDNEKIEERDEEVEGKATEEQDKEAEERSLKEQESLAELEAAADKQETKAKKDTNKLPKEEVEDLRPFPLNPFFRSQRVLSEESREAIYQRVKREGATVALASVQFGVSNERVGAVVRLKQMEKEWIAQGKPLALPYSRAVMRMLPTTPYKKNQRPPTHEPINDLNVHPATRQQLFVPVAESRQFTRVDAGKAFDNKLLPADARIPHPEMVQVQREKQSGISLENRQELTDSRHEEAEEERQRAETKKQAELKALKVVPQRRWDFVFKDISVEAAGHDGKGARADGWRYGVPHQDRKKGIIKIPTKVEA